MAQSQYGIFLDLDRWCPLLHTIIWSILVLIRVMLADITKDIQSS